jgi:hypothetical protein
MAACWAFTKNARPSLPGGGAGAEFRLVNDPQAVAGNRAVSGGSAGAKGSAKGPAAELPADLTALRAAHD